MINAYITDAINTIRPTKTITDDIIVNANGEYIYNKHGPTSIKIDKIMLIISFLFIKTSPLRIASLLRIPSIPQLHMLQEGL